jgi:hypothetical protein
MKAKLLIIGSISEQQVATFRTLNEAIHCGSLLQASTEDDSLSYYVEFKEKRVTRRTMVDSFTRRLPFLNKTTQNELKQYYCKPY